MTQPKRYLIIGDVHGCYAELMQLLALEPSAIPVFVGDLFDRGNGNKEMIEWTLAHKPLCVLGNHDYKLLNWMNGKHPKLSRGLQMTVDALQSNPTLIEPLKEYLTNLPLFLRLVVDNQPVCWVAHGALKPDWPDKWVRGEEHGEIRSRCLFAYTTGNKTPEGHPERLSNGEFWKDSPDIFIHGHTPRKFLAWEGPSQNVLNIDTGACFGGWLTGLVYPDGYTVQVDSKQTFGPPEEYREYKARLIRGSSVQNDTEPKQFGASDRCIQTNDQTTNG